MPSCQRKQINLFSKSSKNVGNDLSFGKSASVSSNLRMNKLEPQMFIEFYFVYEVNYDEIKYDKSNYKKMKNVKSKEKKFIQENLENMGKSFTETLINKSRLFSIYDI